MPMLDADLIIGLAVVAAPLVAWIGLLELATLLTRPRPVDAMPASPDFGGDEPPAVVSLLAAGGQMGPEVAESTLLDLAARRYLELRQRGADPAETTVHIRDPSPDGLTPYEQQVFDYVVGRAAGGGAPLTGLTFRDPGAANRWTRRLHHAVATDARARGLSRRRYSAIVRGLLWFAALPMVGVTYVALIRYPPGDTTVGHVCLLITMIAPFFGIGYIDRKEWNTERVTARGREVAARWISLKAYLEGHDSFADLPPAAVTVWERYLSYGHALGVARGCSSAIDLGTVGRRRRRVWSSSGGTWRRVQVRFPGRWPRYGESAGWLLFKAVVSVVLGLCLSAGEFSMVPSSSTELGDPGWIFHRVLVLLLFGYGGYTLLTGMIATICRVTVTGEVVWLQPWKSQHPKGGQPVSVLYYLAVDDGRSDQTVAWALPGNLVTSVNRGDVVTIKARRWTRQVRQLVVIERRAAPAAPALDGTAGAPADLPENAVEPSEPANTLTSAGLLTTLEVSRALNMAVTADFFDPAAILPFPASMQAYRARDTGKQVLVVTVSRGMLGRIAALRRGRPLPGIGDRASVGDHWAVACRADTTVRLGLYEEGRNADPRALPWLLSLATSRLTLGADTTAR
ncbi:MAG TPA: hypothetical protein VK453_18930 [Micromonosporaceae bacterium]|nr:hypothetical protein [Micromonosporaceae bacterium]